MGPVQIEYQAVVINTHIFVCIDSLFRLYDISSSSAPLSSFICFFPFLFYFCFF